MIVSSHRAAWIFVGPSLVLIAFFLVYPTLTTAARSFFGPGADLVVAGTQFVGLENWEYVFSNSTMLGALRNNALWAIVFTFLTVSLGLILAVLSDRVRYEKWLKAAIFVPAAISMVGAAVIWKFMYAYRPPQMPQIGVLNAIVVALGGEPVGWLIERPWTNNLALITVGIWVWTGFCLVILSAAYKNISRDLFDAARLDGASEWQLFWRIILPLMVPTISVLTSTMLVQVLKVFDIVYVMTNGAYGTEVVANRMYKEMFNYFNYGRASAIAMVLLLLVLPILILNVRRFSREAAQS